MKNIGIILVTIKIPTLVERKIANVSQYIITSWNRRQQQILKQDETAEGGLSKLKYCWLCKLFVCWPKSSCLHFKEIVSLATSRIALLLWCRDSVAAADLYKYSGWNLVISLLGCSYLTSSQNNCVWPKVIPPRFKKKSNKPKQTTTNNPKTTTNPQT